jgi:uncharacterized membrane protein
MKPRNRQARIAWAWGCVAMAAAMGSVLPSLAKMSGMAGGYAISFVGAFIATVSLIAVVVFWGREPVLRTTYSALIVCGEFFCARQQHTVQIPVPPGETERAEEAAEDCTYRDGGAP